MTEQKIEDKKAEEKKEQSNQAKKDIAAGVNKSVIARGKDSPISTKHAIAICRFIRNKTADEAISMLQEVVSLKKAVPMTGELPHRKGMCSGRYPINASRQFIKLLKNLNANASNLGVDSSQLIIHAKANLASRRRFSRRAQHFKRTDVFIELKQKQNKKSNKMETGLK